MVLNNNRNTKVGCERNIMLLSGSVNVLYGYFGKEKIMKVATTDTTLTLSLVQSIECEFILSGSVWIYSGSGHNPNYMLWKNLL